MPRPKVNDTEQRKREYLEAFRRTGNVSQSCAAAGIGSRGTVYEWQERDDQFAAAHREAEIAATELLEAEAHRRAVFGVEKSRGVYHKGQLLEVVTEREYSDTLLIFLLKARAPDKYRERFDVRSTATVQVVGYESSDLDLIK